MEKCTARKDGYAATLCQSIRELTEIHPTAKAKGVFQASIVDVSSGEKKGERITLHSGEFRGKGGIVANYCPFCGGSLRDFSGDGAE